MPKIKITDSKGLVQSPGEGVEFERAPYQSVRALTADTTLTQGGAFTLENTAAITVTMPTPSSVPGAFFTFRTVQNDVAHDFTGSTAGETTFSGASTAGSPSGVLTGSTGGALALSGGVGASVTMVSDGAHFLVVGNFGATTFSGFPN